MRTKKLPSQTLLLTLFRYHPRSGVLRRWDGGECGRKVSVMNVDYWTARVVWKMKTGREPDGVIDFVDGNPANLRWRNLQELTHAQHRLVGRAHRSSGTGVRGVYKVGPGRYRAQLWRAGRAVSLGTFTSLRAAGQARRAALSQVLEGN